MSKHETPMVLEYWSRMGGTLVEEYCLVSSVSGRQGRRLADAMIILDGPRERSANRTMSIGGRNVIVVQAKASRLGMYLLGQALFSRDLTLLLSPASVRTVALCSTDDAVLRPLAEKYGIEVEVIAQPDFRLRPNGRRRPVTPA